MHANTGDMYMLMLHTLRGRVLEGHVHWVLIVLSYYRFTRYQCIYIYIYTLKLYSKHY